MSRFRNLEFDAHGREESGQDHEERRDAVFWKNKADAEYRNSWYDNALRFYARSLEMDVSQIPAWVGQTRCLIWLGEYPEAEVWSNKALERFKENGDLVAALAQCNCRMRRFGPAQELSDRAMKASGDSAYRWTARGEVLLARKQSTAEYCFQRAVQQDGHWSTSLEIGAVCVFWDYAAKAVPWLRKATEAAPEEPVVWLQLARAQRKLRQVAAARRTLQECLKIAPGNRLVHAELAELEHQSDERSWFGKIRRLFE